MKKMLYSIILFFYIGFTLLSSIILILNFKVISIPFGSFFVTYSLVSCVFGEKNLIYFFLIAPIIFIALLVLLLILYLKKSLIIFSVLPILLLSLDFVFQIITICNSEVFSSGTYMWPLLNLVAIFGMIFCLKGLKIKQ